MIIVLTNERQTLMMILFQDSEGQTALHYAASCAHLAIVRLLLRAGADPTIPGHWSDSSNARLSLVNIPDNDGLRPCNEETDEEIVKLFREKTE